MFRSLHTAAGGMKMQQLYVDNIAHNLSNANTTAYKKNRLEFQDLLYHHLGNPSGQAGDEKQVSSGLQIGSGSKVVANLKTFQQGALEETQREMDVAIQGEGFFQITYNENELRYSRDGSFKLDNERNLVTSDGYLLFPPVTVPEDAKQLYFGRDGTVSAAIAGQEDLQILGEIQLARFPNKAGLFSEGQNLYRQTIASGEAILARPGEEGNGQLVQNFLERSNVDVVSEMVNLISAQRVYEINSKVIRSSDEMLSMANNLIT